MSEQLTAIDKLQLILIGKMYDKQDLRSLEKIISIAK